VYFAIQTDAYKTLAHTHWMKVGQRLSKIFTGVVSPLCFKFIVMTFDLLSFHFLSYILLIGSFGLVYVNCFT